MNTEHLRAYVLEELRTQDDKVASLVEMGNQLPLRPHNAGDLQPILQGIERIRLYRE